MQTFLTPPSCANTVARLLASTERALSLPSRFVVVGAIAYQWRLVERSGAENDRVDSVAFDGTLRLDNENDRYFTFSMVVSLALRSLLLMMAWMTTAARAPSLQTRLRLPRVRGVARVPASVWKEMRQRFSVFAPDVATGVSRADPLNCRPRKTRSFNFCSSASCRWS